MPSKRVVIAVILSVAMVMAAGCAGWGTDDPTGPTEETDGNGEAQAEEDSENDGSGGDTEETSDGAEGEGAKAPDDTSSTSGGDRDARDGAEASNTDTRSDETDDSGTNGNDGDTDDGDSGDSSNGESGPDEGAGDAGDSAESPGDGERVTCDAFGTQEAAQEYFDEDPDERGHLDGNDDGIPCEHLPSEGNGDEEVYTLTVEATSPVTLERTWEDASTTREPTNGTVEFSVIEGSYTLSAEGYYDVPEEHALTVDSDMTIALQNEDGEEIEVNVVDAETGEGIEGAEISGVCNWYYSAGDVHITGETDADGVADARAELSPTDCDTTVSAEGYEDGTVNLSVPEDDGMTVELEPETDGDGELSVVDVNIDQEGQNTRNEWILFRNTGTGTLDLTGWTVADSSRAGTNLTAFSFLSMTLEPGEEVRLISGKGENTNDTVYWGSGNPIWNQETGDTVIVRNEADDVVLRHHIEAPESEGENGTNDGDDASGADDDGDESGEEGPATGSSEDPSESSDDGAGGGDDNDDEGPPEDDDNEPTDDDTVGDDDGNEDPQESEDGPGEETPPEDDDENGDEAPSDDEEEPSGNDDDGSDSEGTDDEGSSENDDEMESPGNEDSDEVADNSSNE